MRYHWTSKYLLISMNYNSNSHIYRYEIASEAPGWQRAEQEVLKATKKGAKPSAISVKTTKPKRKAGESAAEIYEEEMGEKKKDRGNKKAKTGKKH